MNNEFGVHVLGALPPRIFRFTAERLSVGACPFGTNTYLASNAANLAEVLNCLQQNPVRFTEFNRLVHQILPQVQQVTVRPIPNNSVQIIVWPHDPRSEREDVAIPLDQCGTGIGQVLAILYVAVHSPFPRVILIDEPQSFLHPGAVRKLIEVLASYRQHQFIISTHSPTVISAADPENIIVARLHSGVSTVDQVGSRDNRALESLLSEIGAHLSDLFGADSVLWVEGGTEEICFPLILRRVANKPLMGTAIVGVRRTGDLETKDAARILEIYSSLAASGTLIPSASGFILDRECRTPDQLEDIKRRSKGVVTFLERRMYENYLLNPAAIAHVVNSIKGFRDVAVSTDEVIA
jgi:putative AbiEii toxin of type IV toxin-antitoxin system